MKTIYILWLRQLKRYTRSKQRMFASLAQPILFLFAFGFGFGSVFQKAGEGNYMQFLACGIICMAIMFTAVFSGIEIIWDKQFGFLKETLVAPVSRFNIMLGRTLGGATVAVFKVSSFFSSHFWSVSNQCGAGFSWRSFLCFCFRFFSPLSARC